MFNTVCNLHILGNAPVLTRLDIPSIAFTGDLITLTCKFQASNSSINIYWKINDILLPTRYFDVEVKISNAMSTLKIKSVLMKHSATYTCSGGNSDGVTSLSGFLMVYGKNSQALHPVIVVSLTNVTCQLYFHHHETFFDSILNLI